MPKSKIVALRNFAGKRHNRYRACCTCYGRCRNAKKIKSGVTKPSGVYDEHKLEKSDTLENRVLFLSAIIERQRAQKMRKLCTMLIPV